MCGLWISRCLVKTRWTLSIPSKSELRKMLNSVQLYSRNGLIHILNSAILISEVLKFLRIKLAILRAFAMMNLACSEKLRLGEYLTPRSVTLFNCLTGKPENVNCGGFVDPKLINLHLEGEKGMSHCLLQVYKRARSSWIDVVFSMSLGLEYTTLRSSAKRRHFPFFISLLMSLM